MKEFFFGVLITAIVSLSVAFYASFNGYLSRSVPFDFNGYVVKGHPQQQGYNENDINWLNKVSSPN